VRVAALTLGVALALAPSVLACKRGDEVERSEPRPLQTELTIAPVVDDHPWVMALVTTISINPPDGVDARLEGRTGPQGLRHPEPIIEGTTREAIAAALAAHEAKFPRSPELTPVWEPTPFGPNNHVAWRLYFVDSSRGFVVDADARASIVAHDHGPSVHVQLGETQTARMRELSDAQVGRRLAFVIGDEIIMLPVVMDTIEGGDLQLLTNPREDPQVSAPRLLERLTGPG
jgi:hypothetical protein